MEEAYEKQSQINAHHAKEIERLKQLLQQYEQQQGQPQQQSQIIKKSIL